MRLRIGWAVTVLTGCAIGGGTTPVRDAMLTHFDLATQLRRAALLGDLSGVRRSARQLADLDRPPDLGPEHQPRLVPFARAAREAELARSVDEAARATAGVAAACAECHESVRAGLGERLAMPPAPSGRDATAHASQLGRVATLLWNGVAAPSEELWSEGAAALRTATAGEATGQVQALGTQAADAAGPDERARLLGEVWATCAGCHSEAAGT